MVGQNSHRRDGDDTCRSIPAPWLPDGHTSAAQNQTEGFRSPFVTNPVNTTDVTDDISDKNELRKKVRPKKAMCVGVGGVGGGGVERRGVMRAASSSISMQYVLSSLLDDPKAFLCAASLALVTSGTIGEILLSRYNAIIRAVNVPSRTPPAPR